MQVLSQSDKRCVLLWKGQHWILQLVQYLIFLISKTTAGMFTTTCESFIAIRLMVCPPMRDTHTHTDTYTQRHWFLYLSYFKHACGGFGNLKYLKVVLDWVPDVALQEHTPFIDCDVTFKSWCKWKFNIYKNQSLSLSLCVPYRSTPFIRLRWNIHKL